MTGRPQPRLGSDIGRVIIAGPSQSDSVLGGPVQPRRTHDQVNP